jgi:hypothetical protein
MFVFLNKSDDKYSLTNKIILIKYFVVLLTAKYFIFDYFAAWMGARIQRVVQGLLFLMQRIKGSGRPFWQAARSEKFLRERMWKLIDEPSVVQDTPS